MRISDWSSDVCSSDLRDDGSSAFKDATGAEVISHFFGQSSFSSAVVADEKSLVKVDAAYDLSVLAPLGCGIQTGAGAVFNFFKIKPGESIAIIGAGADRKRTRLNSSH